MSGAERLAERYERLQGALAALEDRDPPVHPVVGGGVAVVVAGVVAWAVDAPWSVARIVETLLPYVGPPLDRGAPPAVARVPREQGVVSRVLAPVVAVLAPLLGGAAAYTRDHRALFAGVLALVPSTLFLFAGNVAVPDVVLPLAGVETTTDPGRVVAPTTTTEPVAVRRAAVRYPPVVGTFGPLVVAVATLNAATETGEGRSWVGLSPRSSAAVAGAVSLLALGVSLLGPEASLPWTAVAGAGVALALATVTLTATGDRRAAVAAAALGAVPGVLAVATLSRATGPGLVVVVALVGAVVGGAALDRLRGGGA